MPSTPYLVVDAARMRLNIRRIGERAEQAGVALRPHVKTHKSPDIAHLQAAAGARGITVATIGEAEVFTAHGFDDIFIGYPLWLDEARARRLRDLARAGVTVSFGIDSSEAAGNAGRLLGDVATSVLVEVDSGHHRSGCPPEQAGAVADAARRAGLDVRGAFTFPGHGYAPEAGQHAASDEAVALAGAATALREAGIEPAVLSGGSTPTLGHSDLGILTELRPGAYVFGDAQQWELGIVPPEQIALTCRATVVSHAGGRLVLDAGSKILGADRAPWATGHGRLLAHPEARMVQISEHHSVCDLAGTPLPPLGSILDVVPNHCCNAVNLVETLYVDGAHEAHAWPVAARGHNT